MKRLLLLLSVAAVFAAVPAFAQYVFVDVNGDGMCNASDVLNDTVTSVDIYFDTSADRSGTPVMCAQDITMADSIFSYEVILRHKGASGDVVYGTYTNDMAAFTTNFGTVSDAFDLHAGFGGTVPMAAGKYKVGHLAITVAPGMNPVLAPVSITPLDANFYTAFGSTCFGADFDNTIKLGPTPGGPGDFTDSCGAGAPTPVRTTTWGAIKNMYK